MTYKAQVRLADGKEMEFTHVKDVAVTASGSFVLLNERGEQIAFFPIMHTAALVFPDKDSNIALVQGTVKA